MSRFDGYFLRQLLILFGFFTLVLVGVFWITRSVSLFDRVISGGQSAMVFLEFTALTLPTLIRTVMPMAVFAAAVYATNRLSRESELTVMLATGSSPRRLARAVVLFGAITGLMMAAISVFLRPASVEQLEIRQAEVAGDVTAQLLNEGEFLHPAEDVTVYIGQIDLDGTLREVFVSDRRDPENAVSYSSATAYLVNNDIGIHLVMVDGVALRLTKEGRRLSSTLFQDASYDISELTSTSPMAKRSLEAIPTVELIQNRSEISAAEGYSEGKLVEELHQRFSWIAICVAVALAGYSTLMLGSFSRFGLWPQILGAFTILVLLEGVRGFVSPVVIDDPKLWILLYLPAIMGVLISGVFLLIAGRPILRKRLRSDKTLVTPA
ncbi:MULTISPECIES: LPS export ABC transporter permease LptF [unclassified Ruegeria]|uniref:LPS export ABC transporter permease LptF n=1 Tax=unclassified Ruegeria TaxID=2625375 RepID=UPI0014893988|nr:MULTISPECIES: LPS export ABC transporter permease LptF [unclassified Ruegeria]NOD35362.1 LPS export ABC transporter permease LptF [Ruegeria sp. HKCCD7296]NOD48990.1 LPS export ABC transporter permease LptF [Ruegeria sp. HKCCD5849]NOD53637.1 LPS export ABC transporter permease LptF [Ruegeria sp. HKCCD5851]NOD69512.1 LPS export ABC transporter permease LptF [Ruegeria sp. HKCCD7303]NOE42873.1 LPS export ABC transporter permease LptF [Ruegeria sp. HKCCD7319]